MTSELRKFCGTLSHRFDDIKKGKKLSQVEVDEKINKLEKTTKFIKRCSANCNSLGEGTSKGASNCVRIHN